MFRQESAQELLTARLVLHHGRGSVPTVQLLKPGSLDFRWDRKAPPKKVLGRGLTQLRERRSQRRGRWYTGQLSKVTGGNGNPEANGGEGGILVPPLPASAGERYTSDIIPRLCASYKRIRTSATVSIVSAITRDSHENGITGISKSCGKTESGRDVG